MAPPPEGRAERTLERHRRLGARLVESCADVPNRLDVTEGFPSVSREHAIEFLEQAGDRLVAAAS